MFFTVEGAENTRVTYQKGKGYAEKISNHLHTNLLESSN